MPSARRSHPPVDDPTFTYTYSRNPYWKKLQSLQSHCLCDGQSELLQGQWRTHFEKAVKRDIPVAKLVVEIGCNAGHVIQSLAESNPDTFYIGLDWKVKAIHRGVLKAQRSSRDNLMYLRAHASRLGFIFGPQEIDRLLLFFPDPWPKTSDWKHRFFTEHRLSKIVPLLKSSGEFEIKTDHMAYFEWMEEAIHNYQRLNPNQIEVIERSLNRHEGNPNPTHLQIPEVTLFEQIFIKQHIPIKRLLLRRL